MAVERSSGVRVTVATARVLRAFLADASRPRYGYELMQETGFPQREAVSDPGPPGARRVAGQETRGHRPGCGGSACPLPVLPHRARDGERPVWAGRAFRPARLAVPAVAPAARRWPGM